MNFFDTYFWQSFVSQLGATIIGVVLGIPVALLINRWVETRTEKERKQKILQLITEELGSNLVSLNFYKANSENRRMEAKILGDMLKTESWRAFSEGGELEWIKDPELLSVLGIAYYSIGFVQNLSRKYFEIHNKSQGDVWSQGELEDTARFIFPKLEQGVNNSREDILEAIRAIEKELTRLGVK